jgi:PAS domain S-box-containing protein
MVAKVSKSRRARAMKKTRSPLPKQGRSPVHIRVGRAPRTELESQHKSLLENQSTLEISRARYAELYDAAPVGYVTLRRTGVIEEINLMGAQLLGLPRSRVVSSPLVVFVTEASGRQLLRFLSHMRRLPGRSNVELELKSKIGGPVFVDLIAIPSVVRDDRPECFQCALIDITAHRQAASNLRASEEKFRRLAAHAPVGIFLCDKDGDCHYVNRRWCEITGLAIEQAQGQGWLKGVHPDDRDRITTAWKKAVQGGEAFGAEFHFMAPNGEIAWVEGSAIPLMQEDKDFTGFVGTLADITERKSSQDAVQRLAAIVEFSHDAIIGKDIKGIITSWNRGAEEVFGYTAAETIGQSVTLLIPPERRSEETEILARLRNSECIDHYETLRRHKSGKLLEISLTISPIKNGSGQTIGASKIARDITEQKRIQRELNHVHAEVLAASRAKDDFLATLSHELRTPLNPVLLLASEAAANPDLSPRVRTDFDTIRKNIELEARLIDDMLDITRISRGKLELQLQPVDIHAVLRDAISTVQTEVEEKHIRLTLKLNAKKQTVAGDAVRLQQIFWNVLKNATKFTPENGKISVETKTVASGVVIQVTDTGIGMTAGEIGGVFEAFSQGTHTGFGGLGLGLAITRKLTELHKGTIRATSKGKGRGAIFVITLPLTEKAEKISAAPPAPSVPAPALSASNPAEFFRILLVEDHEPTRLALTQLLMRRHYKVEAAGSLAEARAFAQTQAFNLLISDIGLPDGSGCDLMREMGEVPGIALTGYGMEEDVARTQTAGFMMHLTKPVRVESLDNALARAFAARV